MKRPNDLVTKEKLTQKEDVERKPVLNASQRKGQVPRLQEAGEKVENKKRKVPQQ